MAKRIIRYFGGLDLLTEKGSLNEEGLEYRHMSYVYAAYALPRIFNEQDEIVEVYGVDRDLTHIAEDGKTPVVLLEVYVEGKKLPDCEVAEYDKQYGYYAEGHCNKEDSYLIIKDRWMSYQYNDYDQKEFDEKLPDIHERYATEYFDKKTIKAPCTMYDFGADIGSVDVHLENRFDEVCITDSTAGSAWCTFSHMQMNKLTGWKMRINRNICAIYPGDFDPMGGEEIEERIELWRDNYRNTFAEWEKFANVDAALGTEAAKQFINKGEKKEEEIFTEGIFAFSNDDPNNDR